MVEIKIYAPTQHSEWNLFVYGTKNATFLHLREYMDYHSSRFSDCSLIAYSKGKIIGVLPANRTGDTLYSHQGLSYGGWLVAAKHFDVTNMLEVFDAMVKFLPEIGVHHLVYKPIPYIYHSYPAQEDLYALFRHEAKLTISNISTTIEIGNALRFNENSRRAVNLARAEGIVVGESADYAQYWAVLTDLLNSKYSVNPVHTLAEISLLRSLFPINIRLFTGTQEGRILGGVVVYDTGIVAHAQYIATTAEGREKKVLPIIFQHLVSEVYAKRKYFDFGTSNEQDGRYLNEGLVMQKTGMGGRGIVYETYRMDF